MSSQNLGAMLHSCKLSVVIVVIFYKHITPMHLLRQHVSHLCKLITFHGTTNTAEYRKIQHHQAYALGLELRHEFVCLAYGEERAFGFVAIFKWWLIC